MFWLSALVLVSEAEEQSTQEIVDSWMMKTQDDHFQQIPCADSCKRWDLSNPDTFNYFWLRDTEWLSTANRYGVGNHLLPEETSTMTGHFLEWTEPQQALYAFVQDQHTQSFYWTWKRSALISDKSPFESQRLDILQHSLDRVLAMCNEQTTTQIDHRGNEYAWMGKECGDDWTLWVEYHPTKSWALRVLGVRG